ncbi:MAG TPA: YcxB family protein, partial [Sphingomicrobium sp.]|nr:YcxB family protein [Sphingomicrobium sp.]
VYIDYSPEGIVTETPQVRTTYKWSTIGTAKKVGSRLFIMITDRVALVVPGRSTSPENMDRLMATLAHEQAPPNPSRPEWNESCT